MRMMMGKSVFQVGPSSKREAKSDSFMVATVK